MTLHEDWLDVDDSPVRLDAERLGVLCEAWGVPYRDGVLMAANLWGVTAANHKRVRLTVTLDDDPVTRHLIIVSADPPGGSPFQVLGEELLLAGERVATVTYMEADHAIGGYFRAGGRAMTLNPAARSACTGCVFCPYSLEAAADPHLSADDELDALLDGLAAAHPDGTLTGVDDVVVSSGCFEREDRAVGYLRKVRAALRRANCEPTLGVLSSVIRTEDGLRALAEDGPTSLWLTVECFTRRPLLLKSTKASLTVEQFPGVLERARAAGVRVTFTYIVGLDDLHSAVDGIRALADLIDIFPNLQIYQAHTKAMTSFRAADANRLEFYFDARRRFEGVFSTTDLRPVPWRNYRPLWHYAFAGQALTGERI